MLIKMCQLLCWGWWVIVWRIAPAGKRWRAIPRVVSQPRCRSIKKVKTTKAPSKKACNPRPKPINFGTAWFWQAPGVWSGQVWSRRKFSKMKKSKIPLKITGQVHVLPSSTTCGKTSLKTTANITPLAKVRKAAKCFVKKFSARWLMKLPTRKVRTRVASPRVVAKRGAIV